MLREIQATGVEVVVTVHGRPVARIEASGETSADTPVNGMGNTRGILAGWPELTWEDFQAAKKLWEPRDL